MHKRVIPCLLLGGAGLVKTRQFGNMRYVGDPINAVRIFNEKEVDELIFLDISATIEGREPNLSRIKEIAEECFMPLGYGGGITTLAQAEAVIRIGVEKIIVNSRGIEDCSFITDLAREFGSQSVIGSVDVRRKLLGKYEVYIHSGRINTRHDPVELVRKLTDAGAGEIMLTSIDREGTGRGYDVELVTRVCASVNVPVIANGGAGCIEDFAKALKAGASAIAAGRMFVFHGPHDAVLITYPEIAEMEAVLGVN
jgi:cyclase